MIVRQITGPSEKAAVSQAVLEALRGWFEMDESRENYIRERAGLPFFAAYDSESPVGCTAPGSTDSRRSGMPDPAGNISL